MRMKDRRVVTYVSKDTYEKLQKVAERRGLSLSSYIRELILKDVEKGDRHDK